MLFPQVSRDSLGCLLVVGVVAVVLLCFLRDSCSLLVSYSAILGPNVVGLGLQLLKSVELISTQSGMIVWLRIRTPPVSPSLQIDGNSHDSLKDHFFAIAFLEFFSRVGVRQTSQCKWVL